MVLLPDQFRISKSLTRTIRKAEFIIHRDSAFPEVIEHCSRLPRPGQEGTWITGEMKNAYIRLHEEGFAHSFEVFNQGKLVGGLYGVSLGGAFFGESMFHFERDASKVALYHLVEFAKEKEFDLIDAQQSTTHLRSLGAEEITREKFMDLIKRTLKKDTLKGKWS